MGKKAAPLVWLIMMPFPSFGAPPKGIPDSPDSISLSRRLNRLETNFEKENQEVKQKIDYLERIKKRLELLKQERNETQMPQEEWLLRPCKTKNKALEKDKAKLGNLGFLERVEAKPSTGHPLEKEESYQSPSNLGNRGKQAKIGGKGEKRQTKGKNQTETNMVDLEIQEMEAIIEEEEKELKSLYSYTQAYHVYQSEKLKQVNKDR